MTASVLPILAGDNGLSLRPVADSTVTQVPQDGDTEAKTTLASCPALCDRNPRGRRDATLKFAVDQLPANATDVRAKLRVYSWHDITARIVTRTVVGDLRAAVTADQLADVLPVQSADRVRKGYNEFDVSASVQGNGTYTFTLSQESHNTRVYWASRENSRENLRPELVLSYSTSSKPTATPTTPAVTMPPPTTSPTPAPKPTTTKPTSSKPSTTAPKPPPTSPTATPPAVPKDWNLVWSDDFNGDSIDRSKWNVRDGEGRDIDLGCNVSSPKNSFVGGGNLTIRALRQSATCSGETRPFTQAYLDTIGKHSWQYGRFEMRAKSPNKPDTSKGLWPAFWLRPNDGGNGEIDVTELPGGKDWYGKSTAAIFYDYTPVKQDTRIALPGGGYPGDGFHTYATEWDATSIKWYLDGKLVWTRDKSTTSWYDKAFHKPYNLRLNFQVGGWLGNPDAKTSFPADFVVDYVKVYQR
ncbi:family 16 glycosylhydrolase [Jidongwangia harbinensis]|uniref:family 16 glycosylhydrolase n=1 Tax=Jidongwangia harbinensis TaxID=2878561 RepID=UPI001CDA4FF1|nr:glycoside hydrolase family 16 protein [Jidongwangia harbinensis]MCA2216460.1 family 16 glycosylhydrolase [Jidongwangia harbinensis]